MRYSGKGRRKKYIIIAGGHVADDYLADIETRLLFNAVWHRLYIPSILEARVLAETIAHLTIREQQVLSYRFRAPNGMALKEIAAEMGITRERVRQIEVKALALMREAVGAREEGRPPRPLRGVM